MLHQVQLVSVAWVCGFAVVPRRVRLARPLLADATVARLVLSVSSSVSSCAGLRLVGRRHGLSRGVASASC